MAGLGTQTNDKNVAAAGTAETLEATDVWAAAVLITAKAANTTNIFVGGSDVSGITNGVTLAAGESYSIAAHDANGSTMEINLSEVYIDATTNGEGVTYSFLKRL